MTARCERKKDAFVWGRVEIENVKEKRRAGQVTFYVSRLCTKPKAAGLLFVLRKGFSAKL
jgi:hypothetical protein